MAYLASAYSSDDKARMEYRYHKTLEAVNLFLIQGIFVYSPIVHCHELAKRFALRTDARFWQNYNHYFIDSFKEIIVLVSEGWDKSVGVAEEISYAISRDYRVSYWSNGGGTMINVSEVIGDYRVTTKS